jgi:hypothetical protein
MKSTTKSLLIAATCISFAPAFVWILVLALLPGGPAKWLTLVVAVGTVLAAFYMLEFVVSGRRSISRALMAMLGGIGLALTGVGTLVGLYSGAPALSIAMTAAPFLCGLYLLYRGRGYFADRNSERDV